MGGTNHEEMQAAHLRLCCALERWKDIQEVAALAHLWVAVEAHQGWHLPTESS